MKKTQNKSARGDLRSGYLLDYSKAKPNRFAAKLKSTTAVVLEPDVAAVFTSSTAINDLLRSAIVATGNATAAKKPASRANARVKGRAA